MSTHPLALPIPGSISSSEELQRLQAVISRINRAIPGLHGQRSAANHRINSLRSAAQGLSPLLTALPLSRPDTSTHPFALPPPGRLSRGDEIQLLQDVVARINRVFPTLLKQRAIAGNRLNACRAATRGLPSKILSTIFMHACTFTRLAPSSVTPPNKAHRSHFILTLSGVSSLWRQIILLNPQLWSHIHLGMNGKPAESCLKLLLLYLERSETMMLDIEIYFHSGGPSGSFVATSREWPDVETLVHPSIDPTIANNMHRIRSLHLEGASVKWLSYTPRLPNLTHFTLSLNCESDREPVNPTLALFTDSPYLYELSLAVGSKFVVQIYAHWSRITILNLTNTHRGMCLELLALCSNLEEYDCTAPYPHRMPRKPATAWSSPVIRSSLISFGWSMLANVNQEELLMFKFLHVPNLRKLNLLIKAHGQQPSVRQFCSRLPKSMTSIKLTMACGRHEQADSCILGSFAPSLHVKDLYVGCLGDVRSAHHTLHWMLDSDFLQDVECLTLCGTDKWLPTPPPATLLVLPAYCSELVVQVIGARVRMRVTNEFTMRLEMIRAQWTPEKQGQLDSFGTGWRLDVLD
jgi:hypothetical protein